MVRYVISSSTAFPGQKIHTLCDAHLLREEHCEVGETRGTGNAVDPYGILVFRYAACTLVGHLEERLEKRDSSPSAFPRFLSSSSSPFIVQPSKAFIFFSASYASASTVLGWKRRCKGSGGVGGAAVGAEEGANVEQEDLADDDWVVPA